MLRKHRIGHEILNGIVSVCCAVALSAALRPLPVRRIAIAGLSQRRHESHQHKSHRVVYAARHQFESLSRRQRRNVFGILNRQKIGQRAKQPVMRRALLQPRCLLLRRLLWTCRRLLTLWVARLLLGCRLLRIRFFLRVLQ